MIAVIVMLVLTLSDDENRFERKNNISRNQSSIKFTGSLLGTTNATTTYLAKRSDKQFNNIKYYQIGI